jgi:hypothetical protein
MQADDKKNMAETMANTELSSIQNSLQLSETQKDQVFSALLQLQNNPGSGDLEAQAEAKKAALQPLLTPAQFDTYSKYIDSQTQMMKSAIQFTTETSNSSSDASAVPAQQ